MGPEQLLGVVCVLMIVLTVVTVIGHGLWMLAAALGRAIFGGTVEASPPEVRCSLCSGRVSSDTGRCVRCGHLERSLRAPAPQDDVAATIRQLAWLRQTDGISADLHRHLLAILRESAEKRRGAGAAAPLPGSAPDAQLEARRDFFRDLVTPVSPATTAEGAAALGSADGLERPSSVKPAAPPEAEMVPVEAVIVVEEPESRAAAAPAAAEPAAHPAVHPLDAEAPLPAPTTALRQTLADFLQAFMAEKNIRWGELVSGLLIVGSAVGLVISLRATLSKTIPYFPALLFMLVTLAIYGAGIYTLRRWNLRSTSRGVLIISLLLAPLNFLAAIIMSGGEQRPMTDPWYLLAVVVGVACCGWITYSAGRATIGRGWWRMTAAVLATSAGQLVIDRLSAVGDSLLGTLALCALPVGGYLAAALSQIRDAIAWRRLSARRAGQILLVLGISSFALLAPLGLFVSHRDSLRGALAMLTPALSLVAAAILGTGLLLQGRVVSRALAGYRTTGTALAVGGGMLMVASVLLAWPQPDLLIAVGLANCAILLAVAEIGRMPLLHTAACGCFALAYLVGFHVLQGNWDSAAPHPGVQWLKLFGMGRSAVALTALAAVIGGVVAAIVGRKGNATGSGVSSGQSAQVMADGIAGRDSQPLVGVAESYGWACAGLAMLSIAIAAVAGFCTGADRALATPVFAVYAAASLAGAIWLGTRGSAMRSGVSFGQPAQARVDGLAEKDSRPLAVVTYLAMGLWLITLVHGLWLNEPLRAGLAAVGCLAPRPVLTGTLLTASLAAFLALFLAREQLGVARRRREPRRWTGLIQPLLGAALVLTALATPSALWIRDSACFAHAGYVFAVALVWLVAAVVERQPWVLPVFQAVATLGLIFLTAGACRERLADAEWLTSSAHLQSQIAVLAVWCLAWSVARRGLWPQRWARRVIGLMQPTVDQVLLAILIVAALIHAIGGCWPGVLAELGIAALPAPEVQRWSCGWSAWLAVASILAALGGALWEQIGMRGRRLDPLILNAARLGVWLTLAVIPWLVAWLWTEQVAAASALRWSTAFYTAATSAVIWLRRRRGVELLFRNGRGTACDETQVVTLRETGLWLGVLPVLLLTTIIVVRAVQGLPLGKLDPATPFAAMGKTVSFGVPLMIVVAVLLGHAVREGIPGYALLSSIVFQYALTLAYALHGKVNQPGFGAEVLQWNATGLGAFSLLWLGLQRWLLPSRGTDLQPAGSRGAVATRERLAGSGLSESTPFAHVVATGVSLRPGQLPLLVQTTATFLASGALAAWSAVAVFLTPGGLSPYEQPLGGVLSYVALGLAAAMGVWLAGRPPRGESGPSTLGESSASAAAPPGGLVEGLDLEQVFAGVIAMLVPLLAMTADRLDAPRHWLAYHVLTYGWLAAAAGLTVRAWLQPGLWRAAAVVNMVVAVLATRGCLADAHPWAPWWSVGAAAGTAVLAAAAAFRQRGQTLAYASVLLAVMATSFYWFGPWTGRWPHHNWEILDLLLADVIAAAFSAAAWLGVEIWLQKTNRGETLSLTPRGPRVHAFVTAVTVILSSLVIGFIFLVNSINRLMGGRPEIDLAIGCGLLVLLGVGLLAAGAVWDRRSRYAVPALYVWGAVLVTWVLELVGLKFDRAVMAAGLAAAGYVTLTSRLWRQGLRIVWVANSWGVPDPVDGLKRTSRWLPIVNLLVSAASLLVALILVLCAEERWMRISSGFTPAILAFGLAALAQKERRGLMQYLSLLMTGLAGVFLSWADLNIEYGDEFWLLRLIRLLIVLAGFTFIYSVLVRRKLDPASDWMKPVRRITMTFGGGALVTLVLVLLLEAVFFVPGVGAPVDDAQTAAVAVVLVGLIAGLLSLALWPGRDPLALSETGRMSYVYGAEVVAALLFLHIYLCKPEWFGGRIHEYWPYIIMAIAFVGVGTGEFWLRRGVRVLGEPLRNTGTFLPLVPALGMWVVAAERTDYSVLLFLVGLLYVMVSFYRHSSLAAAAAVVAGNGALWSLLRQTEFDFRQHPQLWLIPPAVSVLIAGQLNRRRLDLGQLTALRYASILVIYLSSTSEMFLRGIGESLWPPMVLAALSVVGVLVGIALQVRAFLYLGASFVLLSVVSMVWHASRAIEHSWPWWAFGIGLGMCILTLFGVFEKKRLEVTAWIERLRQWEQ